MTDIMHEFVENYHRELIDRCGIREIICIYRKNRYNSGFSGNNLLKRKNYRYDIRRVASPRISSMALEGVFGSEVNNLGIPPLLFNVTDLPILSFFTTP